MPPEPEHADLPVRWLENARAEMAMARIPLPPGALYEQLCFHAQQAAEKSLKAILLAWNIDFPPTHNLQALVDRLPPEIQKPPFLDTVSLLIPISIQNQ